MLDFIWNPIHLAFAGVVQYILHWGLFFALACGLAAAGWFSQAIPIVGDWLYPIRRDLYWAAFGCLLIMYGMYLGGKDASNRCEAKQVIVEKIVIKEVEKTTTPKARARKDRWDSKEN